MDRRRHPIGRSRGADGFTLIELLIVVAMIAVLATIAFPILLRSRISAHEGSAIASLRAIHSAQAAYAAGCGSGGYAQSLDDLALKPPTSSVAFIHPPYTTNGIVQSGYSASVMRANGANVTLVAAMTCNGSADDAVTMYVGERHPVLVGETGVRSFAINTEGTLFSRNDGVQIDSALGGASTLP